MCWHSHDWQWERRPEWRPERTAEPAKADDLRLADADRERAVAELSKHAGDGRLTLEEFEERAGEVYAAKTNADLRPVFRGLPSNEGASPSRRNAEHVVRPLVLLALLVSAAFILHAPVLLLGLWFVVPRLLWGSGRHHRSHRAHYDRTRDEELTTV